MSKLYNTEEFFSTNFKKYFSNLVTVQSKKIKSNPQ